MPQVPGAKKKKRTLSLDVDLWERIEDLIGLYGNSLGDVASYIVLNWFSMNQAQIREMKRSLREIRARRNRQRH